MQVERQMFAKLTELLCRKSSQWEDQNSVTVPHLRSRYIILEAKNCCSSDQRDAHGTIIKNSKGPDVTWVDEENESSKGQLDLANEYSELETQVVEFKQRLVTVQQDALLHVPHTDASSIATASHNDALSTTLVLSPSVEANEPSDNSRATYCLDPSRKIYAVRAKIIRQIWKNQTFIRTSVVRENGKQHMAKTGMALQGCSEDNLKAYECLDHFLQSQAAKRLAIKETLEDLHNKRRQSFERSQDLLDEACAAGGLEAVQADITNLGLVVERTEMQGPRQMFAELAERLCRKCVHWEDLNSVSYQPAQLLRHPGGQELLLLGPNGCPRSPCQKVQVSRCHMGE
ncbi:hypothetical protein HPB51_029665 [Rhipicephalus microplus]|uniref:Uncharacterized protein n=1 Tax=Rhipicephalus microplus TaxID=6941 RepID=A0A9J6CTN7_RHIMP|nr:hypothetical protein HPB51_029665 [Rhipicephalus microplus]